MRPLRCWTSDRHQASVFGVFTEFGGKFLPSLAKIIVKISVIVSQKHKKYFY
jgi:hypothetical protein